MPIHNSKNIKSKQINLIPQDEFESSPVGRVLKWALSTFRAMVIVTELIVMSAFLSRFWLDARNSDLNDAIATAKSQIISYSEVESQFRSLQKKVDIAKSIYGEPKNSFYIADISKLVDIDTTLNSLSISENQLLIKAVSTSEKSISQFLANLENNSKFENVTLNQVSSKLEENSSTLFNIAATLKNVNINAK